MDEESDGNPRNISFPGRNSVNEVFCAAQPALQLLRGNHQQLQIASRTSHLERLRSYRLVTGDTPASTVRRLMHRKRFMMQWSRVESLIFEDAKASPATPRGRA